MDQEGTFVWDCWPDALSAGDAGLLEDTSGFVVLVDGDDDIGPALHRTELLLELFARDALIPPLVFITLHWDATARQVRDEIKIKLAGLGLAGRLRGVEIVSVGPLLDHVAEDINRLNCARWAPYFERRGQRVVIPAKRKQAPLLDPLERGLKFVATKCSLL